MAHYGEEETDRVRQLCLLGSLRSNRSKPRDLAILKSKLGHYPAVTLAQGQRRLLQPGLDCRRWPANPLGRIRSDPPESVIAAPGLPPAEAGMRNLVTPPAERQPAVAIATVLRTALTMLSWAARNRQLEVGATSDLGEPSQKPPGNATGAGQSAPRLSGVWKSSTKNFVDIYEMFRIWFAPS